jgi:putative heme iron utilization protein
MSPAIAARRLLRRCRSGSLATQSERLAGFPFVSFVPYMFDHSGRAVLLVSRLAEHTKNIQAENRVALAVQEPTSDVQANARLTLCGTCERVADAKRIAARFARYFPESSEFEGLDFDFYCVTPIALRFIGGFAAVHWITGDAFNRDDSGEIESIEDEVLAHMNTDHGAALRDFCRHFYRITDAEPRMIGIDCDGLDVRTEMQVLRFEFTTPAYDAAGIRRALADLARTCRA